jgi:hypothetical protein
MDQKSKYKILEENARNGLIIFLLDKSRQQSSLFSIFRRASRGAGIGADGGHRRSGYGRESRREGARRRGASQAGAWASSVNALTKTLARTD